MENKPNNEISELLALLQQKVETKPDSKVDSAREDGAASTDELLSLLKKNIGAEEQETEFVENSEYNIDGYEFAEENETEDEEKSVPIVKEIKEDAPAAETVLSQAEQESAVMAADVADEEESQVYSPETEAILQERVEYLVNEAVSADEEWSVPVRAEAKDVSSLGDVATIEDDMEVNEPVLTESTVVDEPTEIILFSIENDETSSVVSSTDENDGTDLADVVVDMTAQPSSADAEEEAFEDEYAENYLNQPAVKRFFRFRRLKNEADEPVRNEMLDTDDFDDVDINLALALGSKDALESSIGYARVRSARNGFYDPFLEEPTADRTYGYDGNEFRDHAQTEAIKRRYIVERKRIRKRFVITLMLMLLSLFLESLPKTVGVSNTSAWSGNLIFSYGFLFIISVCLLLSSQEKIFGALRSCLVLQGEPLTPVAILTVLNLVYSLVVFVFFREQGLPTYNFAVAVFLLFGVIDDSMRLTREKLAFGVVSNPKPKLSLEQLENKSYHDSSASFSFKKDFFVEKVNFVGNFFTRSGRRPAQISEHFQELAFSILISLVIVLFSMLLTGNMAGGLASFVFSMLLCVPMQFLVVGIYPFFHLTKGLSKLDSAVIGDAVTEEYNDADTIYLDDSEMFGQHGARVVGVRSYHDMDFYEMLSYAHSVFALVGEPLCNVFDNTAKEIKKKENVKITGISSDGIEAMVDFFTPVYMGNRAFMQSLGHKPKYNAEDEKKVESGQVSILYMAIGEHLCAKMYFQYTITKRFEKFAAEMLGNGVRVGIRTLDPNVNEKLIAALRKDEKASIKVIRPTPNELIPIGKHSDSGIVTSKNSHMIFKILAQCFNIKRIHREQRKLRILSLLLGVFLSVLVTSFELYTKIPSACIVLYQLIWLISALVYTKSKLK